MQFYQHRNDKEDAYNWRLLIEEDFTVHVELNRKTRQYSIEIMNMENQYRSIINATNWKGSFEDLQQFAISMAINRLNDLKLSAEIGVVALNQVKKEMFNKDAPLLQGC